MADGDAGRQGFETAHLSNWIRQFGDLAQTVDHGFDGFVGQSEAVDKGAIQSFGVRLFDVFGIFCFKLIGLLLNEHRHLSQGGIFHVGVGARHRSRSGACGLPELLHIVLNLSIHDVPAG